MIKTIIAAASENNVIGINNQLPWHLPDDFKFFKEKSIGLPVVMGKKTFLSLGNPLPKRLNVVITTTNPELPEGVLKFSSYEQAIEYLDQQGHEEICVIGGGQIYRDKLSTIDQIYLTRVHTIIEDGDAFFPVLPPEDWVISWEKYHPADDLHKYPFTFQQYKRRNSIPRS